MKNTDPGMAARKDYRLPAIIPIVLYNGAKLRPPAASSKNAAGVILAHNHPSGGPNPSQEDLLLTSRLREAGEVLGIQAADHVIPGYENYAILKERGQL